MPIYLNSTKVGSNASDVHSSVSTKLNKIKINTTQVWTGIPEIYNTVKNATGNITEAQWLEFLNNGCVALARQLSETSHFIGKNVTINNTVISTYKSWKIADFNHDSSGDTTDLIQNNAIASYKFGNSQNYSNCDARTYLINTYLPGFSTDIKNKIQIMNVSTHHNSNGFITLNDKIKLLSMTEMAVTGASAYAEGNQYPIFTSSGTSANTSRVRTGEGAGYNWTRSASSANYNNIWRVNSDGSLTADQYVNSRGLVPVIRFA